MSAQVLREAAALMRKRAEAAQPATSKGGWIVDRGNPFANANEVFSGPESRNSHDVATATDNETAEHIASWHPDVALAVADWLDAMAPVAQIEIDQRWGHGIATTGALTVARAYLGTAPMSAEYVRRTYERT